MEIEFVEFYPQRDEKGAIIFEKEKIIGSVHLYISEFDMDVRGVWVCKNKEKWLFKMPWLKSYDEEGKRVNYPCISFTKPETLKAIFTFLHSVGKKYILKKLKDDFQINLYKEKPKKKGKVEAAQA